MDGSHPEDELIARCRAEEDTLTELRCVLRTELLRAGLDDIQVPAQLQSARLTKDPYDGGMSLVGEWRKKRGKVIGSVVIHENGQLFAELYVTQSLPGDPNKSVDAVVAFGKPGALRSELRLAPNLG